MFYKSFSNLIDNSIVRNKSNGILLFENSFININNNDIQDNDGIGIFIRDYSSGNIKNNNVLNLNRYKLMKLILY